MAMQLTRSATCQDERADDRGANRSDTEGARAPKTAALRRERDPPADENNDKNQEKITKSVSTAR